MNTLEDPLLFPPKFQDRAEPPPWKILIADDEPDVHVVTEMALRAIRVHGRPLAFLHAYSGVQAVDLCRTNDDVALVLLDVVMETEHAGLQTVKAIREELGNALVRIVLRTGHPGQAPEHEVVTSYDINDYKEKTELTSKKLFTLVHTSVSHYRERLALETHKAGLETVIHASATIFQLRSLRQFARGVLQQLSALLYGRDDALLVCAEGIAASRIKGNGVRIVAGVGRFEDLEGADIATIGDGFVRELIADVLAQRRSIVMPHFYAVYCGGNEGAEHVLFLSSDVPVCDEHQRLVELFCTNVTIAFENLSLHERVVDSQRQIIMMLTEAIEERSRETGNHVRRVVEHSMLLGRLYGLEDRELDLLPLASAMHDVGKIGIPDAILHKPGRLDPTERKQMESHARRGQELLRSHQGDVMQAAAIIAGQHHEHWDGNGYPNRLSGDQIHVFGRITALVDVFDALTTRRCYKEPWPIEEAIDHIRSQRARQFDPELVDLMLAGIPQFVAILEKYPD